jgi:NAD(P)-dependent dehydrogenase (short-subunit alcohol dehydrogenase family)
MQKNPPNVRPLAGKTVVITGASSGVGRAAALEFAKAGAHLVLAARGLEGLQTIQEECQQWDGDIRIQQTDVTVADEVAQLAAMASQVTGTLDVWVNNAGVLAVGPLEQMPADVIDSVIKTNLLGYLQGAHAALPYFKKQKRGVLINNISIGGFVPAPFGTAYTAAKFGLRGMVEALAGELAHFRDIQVCALYPAFMDTPGIKHAANYMGVKLGNPPGFDPVDLGKSMVELALHPKLSAWPDWAAPLLRVGYGLFPGITRSLSGRGFNLYRKEGAEAAITAGNTLGATQNDLRIHGSTEQKRAMKSGVKKVALSALALGAFWMVVRPRK